ncbi:MAG: cytochrome c3 family protein, partial [Actinomycetes bacterium]
MNPAVALAFASPHVESGNYIPGSMTPDTCAGCHRMHTAQGPNGLLPYAPPGSSLCFSCHNASGVGAKIDVQTQYDLALPNNPATRSIYTHDSPSATQAVRHTLASDNEFANTENRHSECMDCHNSHDATNGRTLAIQTPTGWTAPGQLGNISGVTVAVGLPAGTVPRPSDYTFKNGGDTGQITREYQLCIKCHSGFTTLPSNGPGSGFEKKWSQWYLDKAQEINPNNASFHPIQGPGTNTTTKMAQSLAAPTGGTTGKIFTFALTDTVRCTNCHSNPRPTPVVTLPVSPGADATVHVSPNRGILAAAYQDRVLNTTLSPGNGWAGINTVRPQLALCFTCHGSPNNYSQYSNFVYHSLHLQGLPPNGGSQNSDIDTLGAGGG